MSSTLLARLRMIEAETRSDARLVSPQWREPFRVTDFYRPVALLVRYGRRGF